MKSCVSDLTSHCCRVLFDGGESYLSCVMCGLLVGLVLLCCRLQLEMWGLVMHALGLEPWGPLPLVVAGGRLQSPFQLALTL
jgi:hypothetical protein